MESMPTPFQHLVYAQALLDDPTPLGARLRAQPGVFLLGNTAGDVQAVSGQPRPETHFYVFPPREEQRASAVMLTMHPELADARALTPERAVFVAGYIAHLIWDEVWAWEVYIPCYLESGMWEERLTRVVHHNAVRVLLDRRAEQALLTLPTLTAALRAAKPVGWLPFVADAALARWRDWLVEQLEQPGQKATAQVFAERMGVPIELLEAQVREVTAAANSDDPWMRQLWAAIARYEARGYEETYAAVKTYFK